MAITYSTGVGKILLVTRNATWMFVSEDITTTGETFITRYANKMLSMKIFPKGFGVLTSKYELITGTASWFQIFCVMTFT